MLETSSLFIPIKTLLLKKVLLLDLLIKLLKLPENLFISLPKESNLFTAKLRFLPVYSIE